MYCNIELIFHHFLEQCSPQFYEHLQTIIDSFSACRPHFPPLSFHRVVCHAAAKSDICQLCFKLHAQITIQQGDASEADIADSDPSQLIRCITCHVPVHLACLDDQDITFMSAKHHHSAAGSGVAFQCPACTAGLHPNSLQCVLCDRSGSLLQKVRFGVDEEKPALSGTSAWAHALCMRWTPDLWFEYSLRDEVNVSAIKDDRHQLKCGFCKKSSGLGVIDAHTLALPHSCIQCQHGYCTASFHVSCAAERGAFDNCSQFTLCWPWN
jgi:hypothetical protein